MTHALTWGYHSEEEFNTVVAFMNADETNFIELGRLLHRYGDCYAHTRLEDNNKPFLEKRMYGDTLQLPSRILGKTLEHFSVDRAKPDLISNRPQWYLEYVKNVTDLIAVKFKLNSNKLDFSVFQEMAEYSRKNSTSLIGIINYHIAKLENKNQFTIPYPKDDATLLSKDAALGDQIAYITWSDNTKKYLKEMGVNFETIQKTEVVNYDNTQITFKKGITFILK